MRRCFAVFFCALSACAGAPAKGPGAQDEIGELRAQISAQSALVAQQQRRIEEVEAKLAALAARSPAPAAPAPARSPDPRPPPLKTVKLGGEGRRPRANPVDRAPQLPASVELKEPDEDSLADLSAPPPRLTADPSFARHADADHEWAEAVARLNAGDHAAAETDFMAFVAAHPQHTAADNALYYVGLVRASRGDCASALAVFDSVSARYPAGDAVPLAQLEHGRCLRILGRRDDARKVLSRLMLEHPDAPEAGQARRMIEAMQGL